MSDSNDADDPAAKFMQVIEIESDAGITFQIQDVRSLTDGAQMVQTGLQRTRPSILKGHPSKVPPAKRFISSGEISQVIGQRKSHHLQGGVQKEHKGQCTPSNQTGERSTFLKRLGTTNKTLYEEYLKFKVKNLQPKISKDKVITPTKFKDGKEVETKSLYKKSGIPPVNMSLQDEEADFMDWHLNIHNQKQKEHAKKIKLSETLSRSSLYASQTTASTISLQLSEKNATNKRYEQSMVTFQQKTELPLVNKPSIPQTSALNPINVVTLPPPTIVTLRSPPTKCYGKVSAPAIAISTQASAPSPKINTQSMSKTLVECLPTHFNPVVKLTRINETTAITSEAPVIANATSSPISSTTNSPIFLSMPSPSTSNGPSLISNILANTKKAKINTNKSNTQSSILKANQDKSDSLLQLNPVHNAGISIPPPRLPSNLLGPNKNNMGQYIKQIQQTISAIHGVIKTPEIQTTSTPEPTRDKTQATKKVPVKTFRDKATMAKDQGVIRSFQSRMSRLKRKNDLLKAKVKVLQSQVNQRQKPLYEQVDHIEKLKEEGNTQAIFLSEQIQNFDKKRVSFSMESMTIYTVLYKRSQKGYNFLQHYNILGMPSRTTVRRFIEKDGNFRDKMIDEHLDD